jgi:hypothetical protein
MENAQRQAQNINLVCSFGDMAESCLLELEQEFGRNNQFTHELKMHVNQLKKYAGALRRVADRLLTFDEACQFGDNSDELLEKIREFINQ